MRGMASARHRCSRSATVQDPVTSTRPSSSALPGPEGRAPAAPLASTLPACAPTLPLPATDGRAFDADCPCTCPCLSGDAERVGLAVPALALVASDAVRLSRVSGAVFACGVCR